MDLTVKCTMCGNGELFAFNGLCKDCANATDTYCCAKCGHLELFAKIEALENYSMVRNAEMEYQRQLKEYNQQKTSLTKLVKELEKIINDENQTVRNVNDSIVRLNDVKAKLALLSPPVRTCPIDDLFLVEDDFDDDVEITQPVSTAPPTPHKSRIAQERKFSRKIVRKS